MRRILNIPQNNMGILLGNRSWNGTTKKLQMLERTYIQHNANGLMSLQVELNGVITEALRTSEFYNNYDKDYWEYGR
jgi:hypothetical protein